MPWWRTTWARVAAALVLAAACVALAAWWRWIRPWQTGPSEPIAEIDRRWAAAVALADIPVAEAANEPLRRAMADAQALFRADQERAELWKKHGIEGPTLSLPPEAEQAVAALVEWHRGGGAMGRELCTSTTASPLGALSLASLALASAADDPADERVLATANLAQALERRGRLLHAIVGQSIVDQLIERARARTHTIGAWRRTLPDVKELAAVMAREHVCGYEVITALEPMPTNELLHYRAYFGAWTERFARAGADPALLRAATTQPEADALPKSMLVRISTTTQLESLADRWLATFTALAELEAREPIVAKLWQARLALEAHVIENGAFPQTLAEVAGVAEGISYERQDDRVRLTAGELGIEVPFPASNGQPITLSSLKIEDGHERHREVSIELEEVAAALEDASRLAAQGRWVPVEEVDGGGWRLSRSMSNGLYDQLGLQDGDQVTRLDGRLLGDATEARARLQEGLRAGDLELLFTRGESEHSLRLRIHDPDAEPH